MTKTQEIKSYMDELTEKANKYENMRERYDSYAEKLTKIRDEIDKIIAEIRPYLSVSKVPRKNNNYEDIVKEIVEKMQSGLSINCSFLETTYGITEASAHYLINKIRKMPGIEERIGSNKEINLYFRKEV